MVRKIQVMKMRGQGPIPGLHTFRITSAGVEVFAPAMSRIGFSPAQTRRMFEAGGRQKLGKPVPLSNLVADEYKGSAQPAQEKMPRRCSLLSGLLPGASVPAWRRMR